MTKEKMNENGWEYVKSMNGLPMFKRMNGIRYDWATIHNEEVKEVSYDQVRGFEPFNFNNDYGTKVGAIVAKTLRNI